MQNVSLMGLGTMGAGMAGQLLKAGFPLAVYNRTSRRADPFVSKGARLASSPREAAREAEIVFSMVADDAASRDVWLGSDGALRGMKNGAIAVECSTLSSAWIRELAGAAKDHQVELLDAPVTGSKTHAESGELLLLVGGTVAALERARPVLTAVSRDIIHLGPSGSGALIKLINNFLCGVQAASLGEAIALIEKSGLDREKALSILGNGAPGSPLVKGVSSRMAARAYGVNFLLDLMRKDLRYAITEGEAHALSLRTAAAALARFEEASGQGWGEQDFAAVVEASRHEAGAR